MAAPTRPLAMVTGASSGIGYELAKLCAENGYDLVIGADRPEISRAADTFRSLGADVQSLQADLGTIEGNDRLIAAAKGHVIDTNITGTIYLIQKLAREMRNRGEGKILITGSIAGFMPGTFQAVYNGTKAFIDSFSFALRAELNDTGVTVTCLMPGATETDFFERAGMEDTRVGSGEKDDPADVARTGFEAMMQGDGDVVSGWKNKLQSALAAITPSGMLAEQHRKMAEPGSAKK